MMNKEELRKKLAGLPLAKALKLAEKETAFWDVHQIHKLTSFKKAVDFLLSWPAVEAVGLLKQMEPLAAGLLVSRLRQLSCEPGQAQKIAAILLLCDNFSALMRED
ncbi:MAG: hypothetical protein AAB410_01945 [Patescibacteria group bacterium]